MGAGAHARRPTARSWSTTAPPTAPPSWPSAWGPASCASPGAASARPASPACAPPTTELVAFMDCDGSLDPAELPRVIARSAPRRRRPRARRAPSGARRLAAARPRSPTGRWRWSCAAAAGWRCATWGRCAPRGERRCSVSASATGASAGRWRWSSCAQGAGWRVAEVPVTYRARSGRSKVTGTVRGTVRAVRDMAAVLRLSVRRNRLPRDGYASRAATRSGARANSAIPRSNGTLERNPSTSAARCGEAKQ